MPTLTEAYSAKDILMDREKLSVIVLGGDSFLIKDSRASAERESSTPFDGWKHYTYAEADTAFGDLPAPA